MATLPHPLFMALPTTTPLSPAALCSSSSLTSFVRTHLHDAYNLNITFSDSFSKASSHFLSREDIRPPPYLFFSIVPGLALNTQLVLSLPTYAQGPF